MHRLIILFVWTLLCTNVLYALAPLSQIHHLKTKASLDKSKLYTEIHSFSENPRWTQFKQLIKHIVNEEQTFKHDQIDAKTKDTLNKAFKTMLEKYANRFANLSDEVDIESAHKKANEDIIQKTSMAFQMYQERSEADHYHSWINYFFTQLYSWEGITPKAKKNLDSLKLTLVKPHGSSSNNPRKTVRKQLENKLAQRLTAWNVDNVDVINVRGSHYTTQVTLSDTRRRNSRITSSAGSIGAMSIPDDEMLDPEWPVTKIEEEFENDDAFLPEEGAIEPLPITLEINEEMEDADHLPTTIKNIYLKIIETQKDNLAEEELFQNLQGMVAEWEKEKKAWLKHIKALKVVNELYIILEGSTPQGKEPFFWETLISDLNIMLKDAFLKEWNNKTKMVNRTKLIKAFFKAVDPDPEYIEWVSDALRTYISKEINNFPHMSNKEILDQLKNTFKPMLRSLPTIAPIELYDSYLEDYVLFVMHAFVYSMQSELREKSVLKKQLDLTSEISLLIDYCSDFFPKDTMHTSIYHLISTIYDQETPENAITKATEEFNTYHEGNLCDAMGRVNKDDKTSIAYQNSFNLHAELFDEFAFQRFSHDASRQRGGRGAKALKSQFL